MPRPLSNDWTVAGHNALNLLDFEEEERKRVIQGIRADLVGAGLAQAYSHNAIRNVVADLYRTFGSEIELYIFAESPDLAAAVTADVSLAWLNLTFGGQSVRQHILDRLA